MSFAIAIAVFLVSGAFGEKFKGLSLFPWKKVILNVVEKSVWF